MANDSQNPGEDSRDTRLVTVAFRVPVWLRDEIRRIAGLRISDQSSMVREALHRWWLAEKDRAA